MSQVIESCLYTNEVALICVLIFYYCRDNLRHKIYLAHINTTCFQSESDQIQFQKHPFSRSSSHHFPFQNHYTVVTKFVLLQILFSSEEETPLLHFEYPLALCDAEHLATLSVSSSPIGWRKSVTRCHCAALLHCVPVNGI